MYRPLYVKLCNLSFTSEQPQTYHVYLNIILQPLWVRLDLTYAANPGFGISNKLIEGSNPYHSYFVSFFL